MPKKEYELNISKEGYEELTSLIWEENEAFDGEVKWTEAICKNRVKALADKMQAKGLNHIIKGNIILIRTENNVFDVGFVKFLE